MIYQTNEILQNLANFIGLILSALESIIKPIGAWMKGWISVGMEFLIDNFSTDFTFYIIVGITLVIAGIIVNIVWPGDKKGSIYSSIEKIEEIEDKGEVSGDKDITGEIKRCKDCGNPIGDQNICPLCGARN